LKLRAERVAPQLGSFVFIAIFYLTDFRIIAFVPKMAFSCLLSLAFIDIILTWFIRSYAKTKEKLEWLVVPLIVIFAFGVGLLEAVFLGIALSTFIFVSAFFRSGVVKFAASGKDGVRSTIERPVSNAQWLDEHGDLIQVVILQNYLFFGNASSILEYVSTLFDVPTEGNQYQELPPKPRFVILDMAL
jgi:sulfate permease, SulP family